LQSCIIWKKNLLNVFHFQKPVDYVTPQSLLCCWDSNVLIYEVITGGWGQLWWFTIVEQTIRGLPLHRLPSWLHAKHAFSYKIQLKPKWSSFHFHTHLSNWFGCSNCCQADFKDWNHAFHTYTPQVTDIIHEQAAS
jgi:hypothetical protein